MVKAFVTDTDNHVAVQKHGLDDKKLYHNVEDGSLLKNIVMVISL